MFSNISTLKRSVSFCLSLAWKSSKFYTLVRILGNFFIPLISIFSSYLVKIILDMLVAPHQALKPIIWKIGAVLILELLLAGISSLIQHLIIHATTIQNSTIQNAVSLSLLDKSMSSDIALFDNTHFYDKFNTAKTDSFSVSGVLWNVLNCVSAFFSLVSAFVILSKESCIYALYIVLLIVPVTIANRYYTKKIYQNDLAQINNQRQKDYLFFLGSTKEYASGIRCWNLVNFIKNKYINLWNLIIDTKKKLSFHKTIVVFFLSILPEIVICMISFQLAENVLMDILTVGDYTFYTGIMAQMMGSAMGFLTCIVAVYDNKLKIENLSNFETYVERNIQSGTEPIDQIQSIEFRNVTFRYPGTEKDTLKGITFLITAPEKIALVGKNGAGKSTLFKLLLRLYDTTSGEIKINGKPIQEYNIEKLHRCFGIYFQNSPNFSFTLLENVILNREVSQETDNIIKNLLEECNASEILKSCGGDLHTYITRIFSEQGIELSEGQHQKLAIVRALYERASCFLLDEPSSSLDPETERCIFKCFEKTFYGKCAILTSHRLSNVYMVDRIFVLEDGEIAEQGTLQELLKERKGKFAELYEYQAQKFQF